MILCRNDLLEEESLGNLAIENRLDYSPFSLDIRIAKLFRNRYTLSRDTHTMSQEEFIENLEQVSFPGEGLVVDSSDFYLWQPVEKLFLSKGLAGEVTSRSGWARLGVRVQSVDSYLHNCFDSKHYFPLLSLKTASTKVLIKPGDAIAQLFVKSGHASYIPDHLYRNLVDERQLSIQRDGKLLSSSQISVRDGIELTLGQNIKVYTGRTLVPGFLKGDEFEDVQLDFTRGLFLSRNAFFLSSSEEHVEIPEDYVGYVTERHSFMGLQRKLRCGKDIIGEMPFFAHANAPYIGPKSIFRGCITFENLMIVDGYIRRGMRQSDLLLEQLSQPVRNPDPSSYNNQHTTTLSRIYIK